MSFRARLVVVFLLAALIPMVLFALFVRDEMSDRLASQYDRRVRSIVEIIEGDLAEEGEKLSAALTVLKKALVDDNRFRRAAVDRLQEERRYLLDYAGNAMRLAGLSMFQIQNESGRIISSGHFRNEYDRMEPNLPGLLTSAPDGMALVQTRAPEEPFVALARVESFGMGGQVFFIVAGVRVESRFLARLSQEAGMQVSLIAGDNTLVPAVGSDENAAAVETVRELSVPFIDSSRDGLVGAGFRITHGKSELHALRNSIDRWFLVAVVAACIIAIILSAWFASRISRPLIELADKTARIDFDRLDVEFESSRDDEFGALSRLLGEMTRRLRAGTVQIKDAERRATLGEMARQVNHDIKNGLTPIRNVFRHLTELGRDNPGELPVVFEERKRTLDSSISYLEELASNYAKLSPAGDRRRCNVNQIVRRVVADLQSAGGGYEIRATLGDPAAINGDPVALRRIIENLVGNAIDSLESSPGRVDVSTGRAVEAGLPGCVRIEVADTGSGMSEEQRALVFDDFYTTKSGGTGLGLSIVRRLVMDLDGSIEVESTPGEGSRFIIEIPEAQEGL